MRTVLAAWWIVVGTGCLFPESAEVAGSGVSTEHQQQTLGCETATTLDRYAAGGGALRVQISDGDGATVYVDTTDVSGEVKDSRHLGGALGTWTLSVDARGFAGQFKITLACL